MRVSPFHIAVVWQTVSPGRDVPSTWKLSTWEKKEAAKHFEAARAYIKSLVPGEHGPDRKRVLAANLSVDFSD
jgi:hypothetical protein